MYKADRRLYLNADKSAVVEEGDPNAAFLYLAEGQSAPLAEARKYGLLEGADDADQAAEAPAPAEEPQAKAVSKAPQNKAQASGANK